MKERNKDNYIYLKKKNKIFIYLFIYVCMYVCII